MQKNRLYAINQIKSLLFRPNEIIQSLVWKQFYFKIIPQKYGLVSKHPNTNYAKSLINDALVATFFQNRNLGVRTMVFLPNFGAGNR